MTLSPNETKLQQRKTVEWSDCRSSAMRSARKVCNSRFAGSHRRWDIFQVATRYKTAASIQSVTSTTILLVGQKHALPHDTQVCPNRPFRNCYVHNNWICCNPSRLNGTATG